MRTKYSPAVQGLLDAGYTLKMARAIAKYPRKRWQDVKKFGDKRKREITKGRHE